MIRTDYDTIGINYSDLRQPDQRIAQRIHSALGAAKTVLNVGAGTGSYEPLDRRVTAVEPSAKMIANRRQKANAVIQGKAEDLPFATDSFDAAMAVLTLHHWTDAEKGVREMRRVSRGPVVILTFDPAHRSFWLWDYFPEIVALDEASMPPLGAIVDWLGDATVSAVPVPHDCRDGFLGAYWRRPEAYLDPRIRTGMSSFWAIENADVGLENLANDLNDGTWARKNAALMTCAENDVGYRLIVAG